MCKYNVNRGKLAFWNGIYRNESIITEYSFISSSSIYPVQIKVYSFSTTYWTSVITAARHNQAKNTGNTDKLKKNGKETNVGQIIYHLCHVKANLEWILFYITWYFFFHRIKCEVNPLDLDRFLKCVLQHLVKSAWLYITSCLSQEMVRLCLQFLLSEIMQFIIWQPYRRFISAI